METPAETKKQAGPSNKVVIAAAAVIVAVVVIIAVVLLTRQGDDADGKIGYASDATVMLDEASLQAAMDEALANAASNSVALQYKNNAYSDDGINFECYIANSNGNVYDMFLTIFSDAEMTDQLYLSGLVPPGSGFEEISLEQKLEPGNHTVYVAVTQVDEDEETGEQVIKNQVVHTMEFHVAE